MSNNLRQAAQQALEALEWAWGGEPMGTLERDAIAALRAALSEPEQEPISLNNGRLTQYPDGSIGVGAPTPRRPLTDEEIERACVPLGAAMLSFTEVARAIERAHGIGGGE